MADYQPLLAAAANAAGIAAPIVIPTDHFVTLNGIRLHYVDWGNPQLPTLLFLHGGRLQAHTWDLAALQLRDRYHIVALDQRGHGDTEWTPDDKLDADGWDLMLGDLEAFIDHLGEQKIILVGMSMGGINTIRYAGRHSDRLSAVGIVDVAPEIENAGTVLIADFDRDTETLSSFDDFLQRSVQYMPYRPVAHLQYSLTHALKQLPDGRWSWKADHRARALTRSAQVLARNGSHGVFYDTWDDVKNITAPTLLFRGAQSLTLSEKIAHQMIDTLPNGRLVTIDPATHNVHSDNPKDFARELDRFLQDVL
jgi:pimeloyl-ACP methyl ester carboxylesterase